MLLALMPGLVGELKSVSLVELGAGSAEKSRIILDAMQDAGTLEAYVPIDVSADFLARLPAGSELNTPASGSARPSRTFQGSISPFFPARRSSPCRRTISNFEDGPAIALLQRIAAAMQPGDRFLMGAVLVKDHGVARSAYNDSQEDDHGFNLNVLRVEPGAGLNFEEAGFRHEAFFNPIQSRIEMHLVSRKRQAGGYPGLGEVLFREGESIRTEIGREFTRSMLQEMLGEAGLVIDGWHTDAREWYALLTASRAPARRRGRVAELGRRVAVLREDLRRMHSR